VERLEQRLTIARQALATLEELSELESPTKVERDAAIQRFEYTFEAVWKAAQLFLRAHEGVEAGSPKGCIRAARDVGLLLDAETGSALAMADDRNLTARTYNEALAEAIFARLGEHAALLGLWLGRMAEIGP
jgi:nucleotidyltransferase substrate binding protein (TIGR01987 family)